MVPPLSYELRAAIKLRLEQNDSIEAIATAAKVSNRQVRRMRTNWARYGEVTAPKSAIAPHRPRKLSPYHELQLLGYVEERPHARLDELCWLLFDEFNIPVDESTVSRALKRLAWDRKKVQKITVERIQSLRNEWSRRLSGWGAEQLVFIGESAACGKTGITPQSKKFFPPLLIPLCVGDRRFGWAPSGVISPVKQGTCGVQNLDRSKRWSILPAYTVDGYIACEVHQGNITAAVLNGFVKSQVPPLCSRNQGPRSILVVDDATINWNAELREICTEANVALVRLPPQSPCLNPIEGSFAMLKGWIRKNKELVMAYTEEYGGFRQFLQDVMKDSRATGDSRHLFRLAGIVSD